MPAPLIIRADLPKDSKLATYIQACQPHHGLHIRHLHDGALSMVCFECPFHYVLNLQEEEIVRKELEEQEKRFK